MTEPYRIGTILRYTGRNQEAVGLEMRVEEVVTFSSDHFQYRGHIIKAGPRVSVWGKGMPVTLSEDYELVHSNDLKNYGEEDD